jgi:hypothetical protein
VTQADFDDFYSLMTTLRRYYRMDGVVTVEEVTDYFHHLKLFDIGIVDEAIERTPILHPTWFPKWGELYAVCEAVANAFRSQSEAMAEKQKGAFDRMAACKHPVREIQPEPAGGLIKEFRVCATCGHSMPVFARDPQFAGQRAFLATAMKARDAPGVAQSRPHQEQMVSLQQATNGGKA